MLPFCLNTPGKSVEYIWAVPLYYCFVLVHIPKEINSLCMLKNHKISTVPDHIRGKQINWIKLLLIAVSFFGRFFFVFWNQGRILINGVAVAAKSEQHRGIRLGYKTCTGQGYMGQPTNWRPYFFGKTAFHMPRSLRSKTLSILF